MAWTETDLKRAEDQGRAARRAGCSENANNYSKAEWSRPLWEAWLRGYRSA